jgi:hypothetical protein
MENGIDLKTKELVIQELLPAKLPEVTVEESWNYEESVILVKDIYKSAKEKSIQLVIELKRAHDKFSKPGNPNTKTENGVIKNYTWKQYCLDVGINKKTATRWINLYMPIPESARKEKDIVDSDSYENKSSESEVNSDLLENTTFDDVDDATAAADVDGATAAADVDEATAAADVDDATAAADVDDATAAADGDDKPTTTNINESKSISKIYKCPNCGKTFTLDELEVVA